MSGAQHTRKRSARLTLLGLAALFGLPLLVAAVMYSDLVDFRPASTVNRGTLLNPAVPAVIPREFQRYDIAEHWVLLYPLPSVCGERCNARLADLRQLYRALGRDAERLRIVILTKESENPDLPSEFNSQDANIHVIADTEAVLLGQVATIENGSGAYILDPLGNIMMHYATDAPAQDMKDDLERLIKYATTDTRK